jgi:ribosomal protein S8E
MVMMIQRSTKRIIESQKKENEYVSKQILIKGFLIYLDGSDAGTVSNQIDAYG